jgi:hypothetical protein
VNFDTYALTQTPPQGADQYGETNRAWPFARPQAVHALGARLNRKSKRLPPLPLKKKISDADRTVNR